MSDEIVNKVAQSGLITIDLEDYFTNIQKSSYDIAQNLWQGIALKEKDFRAFVKEYDWTVYQDKYVNIYCSEDAVVPSWAYILLTVNLQPYVKKVVFGDDVALDKQIVDDVIDQINLKSFQEARVIVKGCSNIPHAEYALVKLAQRLQPVVKSLMFGEPCSTVPIYKKPK